MTIQDCLRLNRKAQVVQIVMQNTQKNVLLIFIINEDVSINIIQLKYIIIKIIQRIQITIEII